MKGKGVFVSLYRYETHLHTAEGSACSIRSAREQVRHYKELGYEGIVVTDHFFNGNTTVPRNLSWEERINLFYRGYERAKEEGDLIGLSVFFGWEAGFRGTEFLIYGLDKEWLLNHPDMLNWTVEEQYNKIHADGGLVIHAHPFRKRPYIKEIRLFPEYVDGVEVLNIGNNNDDFDREAVLYARKHKLIETAGTDAHGDETKYSGVAFKYKLKDIKDFIAGIQNGKHELIRPVV